MVARLGALRGSSTWQGQSPEQEEMAVAETWWWNLTEGQAVTGDERPRDAEVLGPYPTRAAAEAWKDTVEARNEAWKEEDERWEAQGRPDDEG